MNEVVSGKILNKGILGCVKASLTVTPGPVRVSNQLQINLEYHASHIFTDNVKHDKHEWLLCRDLMEFGKSRNTSASTLMKAVRSLIASNGIRYL